MKNDFYSKLFMHLGLGLFITFLTGYSVSLNEEMLKHVISGGAYTLIFILEFVLAIFFSLRLAKMSKVEASICYGLYTFLTGLTFASIFYIFDLTSVISVFLVTAVLFTIFAIIGMKTNKDLTSLGNILFVTLISIIILSIINIFIGNSVFDLLISILAVIVFVLYTMYDIKKLDLIQNINEDVAPLYGAFELYLDFINIFINLLSIFGNSKD